MLLRSSRAETSATSVTYAPDEAEAGSRELPPVTPPIHAGMFSDSDGIRAAHAGSSRRTDPTRSIDRSNEATTPTPLRSALATR